MFELFLNQDYRLHEWVFYSAVIVVALWEVALPRRALEHKLPLRWSSNISIGIVNFLLIGAILPVGALALAFMAERWAWGLSNVLPLPYFSKILLAVLALDLIHYVSHRLYHSVPTLWRLHQVHHADLDIDFTTANRHHPFEAFLSGAVFLASILILGAHPVAVFGYQLFASASAILVHGNLRLPTWVDPVFRIVLVTPDMHVVHHSALRRETDSNYAQIFSFWDRLFGTYCERPNGGIENMTLGLEYARDERDLRIDRLLVMPFVAPPRAEAGEHSPTVGP